MSRILCLCAKPSFSCPVIGETYTAVVKLLHSLLRSCSVCGIPKLPFASTHNTLGITLPWDLSPTVPAYNSCTRCVDSPGITHSHMLDCHLVSWARMRPHNPDLKTECSFDSQATWVTDMPGLSICLYNQVLRRPVDWCRN